jgi:hypothetical protein
MINFNSYGKNNVILLLETKVYEATTSSSKGAVEYN